MFQDILRDLGDRYGKQVLLTPDDLEEALGISKGQQANLRSQNRFPIPITKIGRKVTVHIYDLAKYLAGTREIEVREELAKEKAISKDSMTRQQKKVRRGHLEKDWWHFVSPIIISLIERSLLDAEVQAKPPGQSSRI